MSATILSYTPSSKPTRTRRCVQPPVKVACLSCRAARTRCDGKPVCSNCLARGKECNYTKSNRGGPRVSRKKAEAQNHVANPPMLPAELDTSGIQDLTIDFELEDLYTDLIMPMSGPGAGLLDLDSDSDHIFDSIFENQVSGDDSGSQEMNMDQIQPAWTPPIVRHYENNQGILNAYYIFIHPYYPILPPPESPIENDRPTSNSDAFLPSSPLALAISAIMALIPCTNSMSYVSRDSTQLRRENAQYFAQLAMEVIESDSEVLMGASPAHALSSELQPSSRARFHPKVPTELEGLLAYLILSVYEYAQRGNIAKMRNRASQAYDAAIRLSLHNDISNPLDECAEARHRAWWMTYMCVLQSSIVSSLAPIITVDYSQFHTPFPTIEDDPAVWPFLIESQKVILQCTQFTVALKKILESGGDIHQLDARMGLLEHEIDLALATYSQTPEALDTPAADSSEHKIAKSLRVQAQIKMSSAKIKLHRYRAFLDKPIFTRKHCDLEKKQDGTESHQCSCSSSLASSTSPHSNGSQSYATTDSSASHSHSNNGSGRSDSPIEITPFRDNISAKVCLKAALTMSRLFENLPYPDPYPNSNHPTQQPQSFDFNQMSVPMDTPLANPPRTMPSFACCAMQGSYALLTLYYKGLDINRNHLYNHTAERSLEELNSAIHRILTALQNYSMAFEALGGMTEQIAEALDLVRTQE